MYDVFVTLAVIVSILLALIVLIQESKGGGLASNFSSSNAIMGVRKTTDFVEKATWVLAFLLVLFSVLSYYSVPKTQSESNLVEKMNVNIPQPSSSPSAPVAPLKK